MKTEDLKNYIFEQCLSEAKTHPLVMRGAQWVIDQIGGYDGHDAKKLARRMSTGIKRTTNEPTAEHVYNAAQFHYGEILRKHSPSMDRPEVYANMRTQLRAHLGLNEDVKSYIFEQLTETSDALKVRLRDGRFKQTMRAYNTAQDINQENWNWHDVTGAWDPMLTRVRNIMVKRAEKAGASLTKTQHRINGLKGDGSPRTSKQESAFNFIMGLKRLTETSDALKKKLIDARFEQGWTAAKGGDKLFHEYMGQDPETGKPRKKGEGYGNPALLAVRDIRREEMKKAWASSDKANNRLKGLKGDGSPR